VGAVSVGIVGGRKMLDICAKEDNNADVDMNVVMTGRGKFVEVQATAEGAPFSDDEFEALKALARAGIAHLIELQKLAIL
jgi:ribonuclease PH